VIIVEQNAKVEVKKKQKEEFTLMQSVPKILPLSKQLAKKTTYDVPIYQRYEKVLAQKQRKIMELKSEIEKKREEKDPDEFYPTFKP